jgi:putative aldouronate transport system substrate-binding protein
MKLKKWVSSVLVAGLVFVLAAGCAKTEENANQSEGVPDLMTYSMGVEKAKLTWDTPITKKITEKTGVSLQYEAIVGDLFQKWDIWRAGGDYPDIVRLDALNLQKYIEAGAVIPLEELIEEHGPHIKEKFGDRFDMLKHEDGHIYSLYSVNLTEEAPADTVAPYVVQLGVLEEAGYPEINTLDELHALIADYEKKHPKIDGQDTIGFAAGMESFMINITFNNPTISADGLPDHGNFYLDGDQVKWNPVSDRSKKYLQFLHGLIQDDLFDIEAFSMDLNMMKAKMAQGRVLSAYAPKWIVRDVNSALQAEGKEDQMYAHLPLLFDANVEDRSVSITPANPGTHEWAISTNAKHPERIIQFIDYLFSDEGQILTNWGIEGVHYEVVDGKRQVLDAWTEKKASDPDALFNEGFESETASKGYWFSIGHGAKLADGDYATSLTSDVIRSDYTKTTKQALEAYGIQTWSDLLPEAELVNGYVWQIKPPESTRAVGQRLDEIWRKSLPNILLSKTEAEFNTEWDAFVKSAKDAGVDSYNKAFTEEWNKTN